MVQINLKQILLWSQQSDLINKFREFGAIPKVGDVKCSNCGTAMYLWFDQKKNDWFWRCNQTYTVHARKKKKCNSKKSVKSLSIFEGAHLNFEQIMIYILEWVHYSEIRKISLEVNISSATAAVYNKFCTEIVIHACFTNSMPIGK